MAGSKTTNTEGHLWVEEGEQRRGTVAEVAPLIPTSKTYSFAVPDSMVDGLSLGQRVRVPIGRKGRLVVGFVVGLDLGVWDSSLRPIGPCVDDASYLTPELITLGREIAEHYSCPLGRTLASITPEAVRLQRGLKTVRFAELVRPIDELLEGTGRVGAKRKAIIDVLEAAGARAGAGAPMPIDALLESAGTSSATLRALVKIDWVRIITRKEIAPLERPPRRQEEPGFELNVEQREALEKIEAEIDAARFSVTLLFGVSGSGKTEVYIRAIRRVIAAGRQAILLVPEILLTTQLVERLASRFTDVAVSHSGLTDSERSIIWREVAAGKRSVVIGTRSAVFAPCPNLGLICVDEEQETSYKNLQAPRFNVRDVAIMRARQSGFPIVLGSATPSVETWYHSRHRKDYRRVVLRRRVKDLPMPKVHIIDMRDEYAELKRMVVLSRTLERFLSETLARDQQAIMLINRRGFSHRIYCPGCKTRVTCPNCNVGLVAHSTTGRSVCHYCHERIDTPTVCSDVACGEKLIHMGLGTQRVEEVIAQRFPSARVRRVDSDTMRHRDQVQSVLAKFEAREIDVLIGTQMIAKGLDFPSVSLVGVVHADAAAMSSDFRASERLFQLITQVAGRAGRADATGRVVVQTTTPTLSALRFALNHDYESFVENELQARHRVGLPPFRRLARIVLSHAREETARHEAEAMYGRIQQAIERQCIDPGDILGPNPCALARLRGRYRYDLLIRTPNATTMRSLMADLNKSGSLRSKAETVIVDVDPVALA